MCVWRLRGPAGSGGRVLNGPLLPRSRRGEGAAHPKRAATPPTPRPPTADATADEARRPFSTARIRVAAPPPAAPHQRLHTSSQNNPTATSGGAPQTEHCSIETRTQTQRTETTTARAHVLPASLPVAQGKHQPQQKLTDKTPRGAAQPFAPRVCDATEANGAAATTAPGLQREATLTPCLLAKGDLDALFLQQERGSGYTLNSRSQREREKEQARERETHTHAQTDRPTHYSTPGNAGQRPASPGKHQTNNKRLSRGALASLPAATPRF